MQDLHVRVRPRLCLELLLGDRQVAVLEKIHSIQLLEGDVEQRGAGERTHELARHARGLCPGVHDDRNTLHAVVLRWLASFSIMNMFAFSADSAVRPPMCGVMSRLSCWAA